jgi:hypothetical protein
VVVDGIGVECGPDEVLVDTVDAARVAWRQSTISWRSSRLRTDAASSP